MNVTFKYFFFFKNLFKWQQRNSNLKQVSSSPVAVIWISDIKEFLDTQAVRECRITLNVYVTWSKHNQFSYLKKKNVSFWRYIDYCVFEENANFKICDVIILFIPHYSFYYFVRYHQNEIGQKLLQYFQLIFSFIMKTGSLLKALPQF